MTSDAKVRLIVEKIKSLSKVTCEPPEMSWFDDQFDPADGECPFLPFSVYLITGTAGAGKSTSITALYQNLNCMVTGATTVAAQNLSRCLKIYCPTIFNAFGFKSRHINILSRYIPKNNQTTADQVQRHELSKYWPTILDITQEFTKKRHYGQYSSLNTEAFETLSKLGNPSLWTTNIIIIDEAGTLSSHILTAVVYFYWFYNSWLQTPLYKKGLAPCIVCVGSPTQTSAFYSVFNHSKQTHHISNCDNVLTFLMKNEQIAKYVNIEQNWALFINNKRCIDLEFGHLLKTLEYNLEISEDIMNYIDRFVVPKCKILNPLEYIGWTRLFLSHNEVKIYLTSLHTALSANGGQIGARLFTCPIVCEVFNAEFEKYKILVNCQHLTVMEWLNKNLHRLSNYSQFIDQDMTAVNTDITETSTKVTYLVKYVQNSYISLNGKTKKCFCGFMGTFIKFKQILDSEVFIDSYANDQPEFVYSFLSTLLYNGMYGFYKLGLTKNNKDFLQELEKLSIPPNICTEMDKTDSLEIEASSHLMSDTDIFYHKVSPPSPALSSTLPCLISTYTSLKEVFFQRLCLAQQFFGQSINQEDFSTFTVNITIRDGVDFTSPSDTIYGLLDYASTVESYKIKGYTFCHVFFGRFNKLDLSKDLKDKMPHIVVEDDTGFVACLENNVNKMKETLENGTVLHLCSAGDYAISSKLAMTITKAQGLSLNKVAVSFGNHKNIKKSHVYVAISRATSPKHLVIDCNPLKFMQDELNQESSSEHIIRSMHNPNTLLVY